MLSKLAGIGALIISVPNALLAMIFFIIAIGSLNFYFPNAGEMMLLGMAFMLGVGFVIGEAVADILQAKNGGLLGGGIAAIMVIVLCVYVNIGAGNYRSKDNERESADVAKIAAANDPRWKALQADRDAQYGLLKNGTYKDDATANNRLLDIAKEEAIISQEYVDNSHVNKIKQADVSGIDWLIDSVFANRKVFTFALLAINLIFGLCIQTWYKYRYEEQDIPFKKTTNNQSIKSTSNAPQKEVKEPKHPSPVPVTAQNKQRPPSSLGDDAMKFLPEKKTELVKGLGETSSSRDGDKYKDMNQRSIESRNGTKMQKKRRLQEYIDTHRNPTKTEMMEHIQVSLNTLNKYLEEMGYGS